ncbi:MAG: toll/interleukin-1 receptor domain-containing protein [Janthinobacterium lividum]
MPTPARTSVFISYSHADSQWLDLLNTHLKPLTRDHKVEVWSDQKIRKGEQWRERIHTQMAKARVAIFLVSASFLGSDFIHAEELPPLLKAAKRAGATLLTIIVRPCAGSFQDSPLSQLQAMNGPQTPLSGMSETEQEKVMASVYDELRAIFRGPPATAAREPTKPSTAAPKTPKRVPVTAAKKIATEEAAAKAKAIARRKAIAKKAADAKKLAAEQTADTTKKPTTKKLAAKPATTRAKKK